MKSIKMNLVDTQLDYTDKQHEIEKLRLENVQLKKSLEKEEFLHKTLYKQFNELNDRILAKERELEQSTSRNVFYKYAFYVILFALIPVYYLMSNSKKDETVKADREIVSSPVPTANQMTTSIADTMQLTTVKPEEKDAIQADTVQQRMPAINNPVIEKSFAMPVTDNASLTESGKDSIYWQGWSAYHEKSPNPYRRSSQKYQVWLEGWKDGENDTKKIKDSLAP